MDMCTARKRFEKDGALIIEKALSIDLVHSIRDRLERVVRCLSDVPLAEDRRACRVSDAGSPLVHITNAWCIDALIARLVTSARLGEVVARMAGWPGARLFNDHTWWKREGAPHVSFHQDAWVIPFLTPNEFVTCWIALDDTGEENGTLQLIPGSLRWPLIPSLASVKDPNDYAARVRLAAPNAGVFDVRMVSVTGGKGICSFHHGLTWHGSPENKSARSRMVLTVHFVRSDTQFSDEPADPIFRSYKKPGSCDLDEKMFPITWREDGYRSDSIPEFGDLDSSMFFGQLS
jgi:phytanoyl-CoA hydroxylase